MSHNAVSPIGHEHPNRTATRIIRVGRRDVEITVLAALILLLVLVGFFPGIFASRDPQAQVGAPFTEPDSEFFFGTDDIGRDLFSRVIHGTGISLGAAVFAVFIALIGGIILGVISGLRQGGFLDWAISRVSESVLAVPGVLLAMAVIAAFGRGATIVAIGVGIGQIPFFARVIRAQVIKVRILTFVEAAEAAGSTSLRTIVVHILPALARPLLGFTVLHLALVMLEIGGLSYLGFGEPPPSPEWGEMIAAGQRYISYAWWIPLIPGFAFVVVVIILNRLASVIGERS